jgi:hypothetical protein
MRSSSRLAGLSLLALCAFGFSADAFAMKPYMWGVGGRIGSMLFPGQYPVAFPKTDAGNELGVEKVAGDITFGAEGFYWASQNMRLGLLAGLGTGSGYGDKHAMLSYHQVTNLPGLDYYIGGAAGIGKQSFTSDDDGSEEKLSVPYYPLRAEAGLLFRQKVWAVEALAFGQYNIPSKHSYLDPAGNEVEVNTGIGYFTLGLEARGLWGDFTKPKPAKKKGRKNKKGSK